ncbi:MAG: hypothetical protein GQ531_07265 [Sulfurovum sp.]|nr:hypothetical protein [Sulfurovum sp.]
MSNENLHYIEDDKNRKLYYHFTPAAIGSNFIPLIVILDDAYKAEERNFEYKMWNVLTPIDSVGSENEGSAWLGEKGDFYVKDLLQELITQIAEEHECEEHIYLYGSGKGGYGAILHGMLCKANAIYAHLPQIRLEETYLRDRKESDLTNFLNGEDDFPIFYLSDEVDSPKSNLVNDTAYFMEACKKHDIRVHLNFFESLKEDENAKIKNVLDTFERMISQ